MPTASAQTANTELGQLRAQHQEHRLRLSRNGSVARSVQEGHLGDVLPWDFRGCCMT